MCKPLLPSTGRLDLVPGSPLQIFLEATSGLSPEERADRLENDAEIVRVHDEAAREGQTAAPNLEDQVLSEIRHLKNAWNTAYSKWMNIPLMTR